MKILLFSLILLNTADSVVSHFLVELDLARELNPFLVNLVGQPSFFIFKAVGIIFYALILWYLYRRYPLQARICAFVLCVFYIALVLWNSSYFFL